MISLCIYICTDDVKFSYQRVDCYHEETILSQINRYFLCYLKWMTYALRILCIFVVFSILFIYFLQIILMALFHRHQNYYFFINCFLSLPIILCDVMWCEQCTVWCDVTNSILIGVLDQVELLNCLAECFVFGSQTNYKQVWHVCMVII